MKISEAKSKSREHCIFSIVLFLIGLIISIILGEGTIEIQNYTLQIMMLFSYMLGNMLQYNIIDDIND